MIRGVIREDVGHDDLGLDGHGGVATVAPDRPSRTAPLTIDLDLEEAFEHRAELTEMCRRIVGDAALAEDVVQETYLQAVRNRDRLEPRDGLMPWLVTVAKRRALNELRRRKYSTPVETLPERTTAPEADPCSAVSLSDEVERVTKILERLTPRERNMLMRQVHEGVSLTTLAEDEDTTVASVRSLLSRARGKLRAAIEDAGARILAPVAGVTHWARRRLGPANAEFQQSAQILPVANERLREIVTAGALSVALAVGGGAPSAPRSATPSAPATNAGAATIGTPLTAVGAAIVAATHAAAPNSAGDAPGAAGSPSPASAGPRDAAADPTVPNATPSGAPGAGALVGEGSDGSAPLPDPGDIQAPNPGGDDGHGLVPTEGLPSPDSLPEPEPTIEEAVRTADASVRKVQEQAPPPPPLAVTTPRPPASGSDAILPPL